MGKGWGRELVNDFSQPPCLGLEEAETQSSLLKLYTSLKESPEFEVKEWSIWTSSEHMRNNGQKGRGQ